MHVDRITCFFKFLVCAELLLRLVHFPSFQIGIPAIAIILRELFISGLREFMAKHGKRSVVKVGWVGKLKTALQMVSIGALILSQPSLGSDSHGIIGGSSELVRAIGVVLLQVSAGLALFSAAQYSIAAYKALQQDE